MAPLVLKPVGPHWASLYSNDTESAISINVVVFTLVPKAMTSQSPSRIT